MVLAYAALIIALVFTFSTVLVGPVVARRGFDMLRNRNRETALQGFSLLLVGSCFAALGFYLFFAAFYRKPSWLERPLGVNLPDAVAQNTIQVQVIVGTVFVLIWNAYLVTRGGADREKGAKNLMAFGFFLLLFLAILIFGTEWMKYSLW